MKYEELKRFVKEFEEKFPLGEVVYLTCINLLERVRADPKNCNSGSVDRMLEFLTHYGMARNVRREDFSRSEEIANTIRNLSNYFDLISGENILTSDFKHEKIRKSIMTIYSKVKELPQIGPTGASKIIHLLNPHLFVMWDDKIREEIHKEGHFRSSREGYLEFLEWIQGELREALQDKRVSDLREEVKMEVEKKVGFESVNGKSLAKLADEYCFQKVHSRPD